MRDAIKLPTLYAVHSYLSSSVKAQTRAKPGRCKWPLSQLWGLEKQHTKERCEDIFHTKACRAAHHHATVDKVVGAPHSSTALFVLCLLAMSVNYLYAHRGGLHGRVLNVWQDCLEVR